MTRKRWADLRDAHLREHPENPAAYAAAKAELEAELAAYAVGALLDLDAGLADVHERAAGPVAEEDA